MRAEPRGDGNEGGGGNWRESALSLMRIDPGQEMSLDPGPAGRAREGSAHANYSASCCYGDPQP